MKQPWKTRDSGWDCRWMNVRKQFWISIQRYKYTRALVTWKSEAPDEVQLVEIHFKNDSFDHNLNESTRVQYANEPSDFRKTWKMRDWNPSYASPPIGEKLILYGCSRCLEYFKGSMGEGGFMDLFWNLYNFITGIVRVLDCWMAALQDGWDLAMPREDVCISNGWMNGSMIRLQ